MCNFILAWVGKCSNESVNGSDFCAEHDSLICGSCGVRATYECHETMGAFVCGVPLCDDCKHHVGPRGTNAYGFHGKKDAGKFKSWMEQSPQESLYGNFLEEIIDYNFYAFMDDSDGKDRYKACLEETMKDDLFSLKHGLYLCKLHEIDFNQDILSKDQRKEFNKKERC